MFRKEHSAGCSSGLNEASWVSSRQSSSDGNSLLLVLRWNVHDPYLLCNWSLVRCNTGRSADSGGWRRWKVWHWVGRFNCHSSFKWILGLSSWTIAIVWILDHVLLTNLLGFFDVWPFLSLRERLPFRAKFLAQLRIVHSGILLSQLFAPFFRPYHERVHGALDVVWGSTGHYSHWCCHCGAASYLRETEKNKSSAKIGITGITYYYLVAQRPAQYNKLAALFASADREQSSTRRATELYSYHTHFVARLMSLAIISTMYCTAKQHYYLPENKTAVQEEYNSP